MVSEGPPKTLVILVAEDRELNATLDLFQSNLLTPLSGDLALCGVVSGATDSGKLAYCWAFPEPLNWKEAAIQEGLTPSDIERLGEIGPEFLAGVSDYPGSAGIVYYWRHQLKQTVLPLLEDLHYEWFVITRSDMRWIVPFPPVKNFDPKKIYYLDGEDYGGVSDRFVMFHRSFATKMFGLYSPLFDEPSETLSELISYRKSLGSQFKKFNAEFYQEFELFRSGLLGQVRRIPYLGFAIRTTARTRWSEGVWSENEGFFVKYPSERRQAQIFAKWIQSSSDWGQYPRGLPSLKLIQAQMDWRAKQKRRLKKSRKSFYLPQWIYQQPRERPGRGPIR